MTEELNNVLTKLAEKLGTSVEKIYVVLTKQAKIEAITQCVYALLLIIATYYLAVGWYHVVPLCVNIHPEAKYSFEKEWATQVQFMVVGLGIGSLIDIIFIILVIPDTISTTLTAILNPEASAIDKILNSLN